MRPKQLPSSVFSVFSVVEELFNGDFTTEVTEDTEDCNNNDNKDLLGRGGGLVRGSRRLRGTIRPFPLLSV